MSVDGFAMTHYCLLSDAALEAAGRLLEVMEMTSSLPKQLDVVVLAMLAKPTTGFRPTGLFVSLYRLWGRARRPYAKAWEERNGRRYFGSTEFSGAVDMVFRQAFRAEAAVGEGQVCATLLWDMTKFYESFDLHRLKACAGRLGFPVAITLLATRAYHSPRYVTLGGFSDGPWHARKGVIAGCSLATSFVKVYSMESYDKLPLSPSTDFLIISAMIVLAVLGRAGQ